MPVAGAEGGVVTSNALGVKLILLNTYIRPNGGKESHIPSRRRNVIR